MQIVEIPVYSISVQLESALRKKEYKEEQIAQVYGILSEKKKKQKKKMRKKNMESKLIKK